jgi:hypothetical protein
MPLARPGDGIPQSNFAISKQVHGETSARHRNVKLCFVRLPEGPNRYADNDLVESLGLAGVTGHGYSLIEVKTGAVANNLAIVEYDLVLINANDGSQLVVEEFVAAVFDVFRETDPVADCQSDLLPLEHAKLPRLIKR